jgi:hypothetical protein
MAVINMQYPNVQALFAGGDIEGLIAIVKEAEDPLLRDEAIQALCLGGEPAAWALVEVLLTTNQPQMEQISLRILGRLGAAALRPLMTHLPEPESQPYLIEALVEIGAPAVEPLIRTVGLSSAPIAARVAAAQALGETGAHLDNPALRMRIIELLVCAGAIFTSAEGAPLSARPVGWPVSYSWVSPHPQLEQPCFQSLVRIGDLRALPLLALIGFSDPVKVELSPPGTVERTNILAEQAFREIVHNAGTRAAGVILDILEWDHPPAIDRRWPITRAGLFLLLCQVTSRDYGQNLSAWERWRWAQHQQKTQPILRIADLADNRA